MSSLSDPTNTNSSSTQSQHDAEIHSLHATNQKLGAFPIVQLANGQKVPTGTVGTLMFNIKAFNEVNSGDAVKDEEERRKLVAEIRSAVPVLGRLGMFELFAPEEWSGGRASEGRKLVGEEARRLGY